MPEYDDVDEAEVLAMQGGKTKVQEFVNEAALKLKLKELTTNTHPDPNTAGWRHWR